MTIEIDEKTELEVTADLLSNVPDKYQKNVGYFTWDFLRAIGKVFVELWDKLSYLTAFYNIENLNYDDLVKFVFQRGGIIAHEETYASGVLTVLSGTAAVRQRKNQVSTMQGSNLTMTSLRAQKRTGYSRLQSS